MKTTTESAKRDPIKRANDLVELVGSILFLLWLIDIVTHGQARFALRRLFAEPAKVVRRSPSPVEITAMHREAEEIKRQAAKGP